MTGLARRSRTEWVVRTLLVLVVLVCGYVSVTRSVAVALYKRDPARAFAIASSDGRVTAQYAQTIGGNLEATPQDRRRADALAIRALRQDPTAVLAVSMLALDRQIAGDGIGARRLFAYAQHLSRRDLQSQIWAIENAVARGDVAGALTHYDIALRTSRSAPDLLFPILAAAIADPGVRRQLAIKLAVSPAWGDAFINFAAARGADPRSTAQLLLMLQRASVPSPREAQASVLDALIVGGYADEAWQYYAAIRPGSDRRRSRDPRFAAALGTPTVLDWTVMSDEGVSGSIQNRGNDGIFDFSTPPGVGGTLLRQIQVLPPGKYRLLGRSSGIDQPAVSRPYWLLTCRRDGRELGRVELPNSSETQSFGGDVAVPADCDVQMLTLIARPSNTMLGSTGQITQVRLEPAQ